MKLKITTNRKYLEKSVVEIHRRFGWNLALGQTWVALLEVRVVNEFGRCESLYIKSLYMTTYLKKDGFGEEVLGEKLYKFGNLNTSKKTKHFNGS